VFSSVILQHDRSVSKGCDIRRLLDRRLSMWQDGKFDVLRQEAQRCDRSLCNSFRSRVKDSDNHVVKVFTKLMLQGNVRAAVRWITERTSGGVLDPSDSVVSALQSKHPNLKFLTNLLSLTVMIYLI